MATQRVPMVSTRTPTICQDGWSADRGDYVAWTGAPNGGTTIDVDGSNTFPFNLSPPFTYPNLTSTVSIRTDISPGTYYYTVGYCTQNTAVKSVNVG